MPTLLFLNACMRGNEVSRTYQLCRAFLDEFKLHHPDWDIQTVDLPHMDLRPFNAAMQEEKERLLQNGPLGVDGFELAWEFAGANKILVGAPYWNLSFPSMLRVYIEHVSVTDITFTYRNDVQEGLCAADHLCFVTTAGGELDGANCGYDYFRCLCQHYGIDNCSLLSAENLDVVGVDTGAVMSETLQQARRQAQNF